PTQQTTYTVTGNNGGSCSGTASVTVSVNPTPTVTATASPATICPGASSTLTASGANVYTWSTQQSGPSITVSPTTTTTYYVAGYNGFNCRGIGQVTVVVSCSGTGSRTSSDGSPLTNPDNSNEITVYPNPSRGGSYVSKAPKGAVVEVYNEMGQRIVGTIIESESESTELNMAHHARGIYFVRISQSGTPVYTGRIVKEEE
ncbi:MAG TPA: T9SS type A sorting domain-containing protein, partial [Cyclobacteriaceae bacterium]|nr:T9SS type A sorting domain-containing protein [Cyclobacteriaceae bacterium]